MYFRGFVYDHAVSRLLVGYTRNLPCGRAVEVVSEGEAQALQELLKLLEEGPPSALVEKVDVDWSAPTGEFESFEIR